MDEFEDDDGNELVCLLFLYLFALPQTTWLLYFGLWAWLIGTAVLLVLILVFG